MGIISNNSLQVDTGLLRRSQGLHLQHLESFSSSASGAVLGPLGNNTESSSPLTPPDTPESQQRRDFREARYVSQNVIRKVILKDSGFMDESVMSLSDYDEYNKLPRVVKCNRTRITPTVDIHRDTNGHCFYSGLSKCGSVWSCPVCCAKIQQFRRSEIEVLIDWAVTNDYQLVMPTLTIPHYESQTISELMEKLTIAKSYFTSGNGWKRFKEKVDFQGLVRSLEVMYGANGWHPHFHELWVVSKDVDAQYLVSYVRERWEKGCQKAGLIPRGKLRDFRRHGVQVSLSVNGSDYFAKQDNDNYLKGMASEISLGVLKKSRKTIHPFQLALLASEDYPGASEKFLEYVNSMKGKAQIY